MGQLNFFRWALQNNVIDYIISHYNDIENDMNDNTKKQRIHSKLQKGKLEEPKELVVQELVTQQNIVNLEDNDNDLDNLDKKDRKKRQPLSVAATNNMNMNKVPVLLNFD